MPQPKLKPGEKHYFVIAEGMQNLSGHKIWTDDQGHKRITMTPNAAEFWKTQAAIADQPLTSMPQQTQHAFRAMHGRPSQEDTAPQPKAAKGKESPMPVTDLREQEPESEPNVVGGETKSGSKFVKKK